MESLGWNLGPSAAAAQLYDLGQINSMSLSFYKMGILISQSGIDNIL